MKIAQKFDFVFKGKCAWCLTTVHELRYIFFTFNLFHHLFLFWSIEHQSLSTICRQFWSPMQLKRNHVSVAHSHSLFIHCTIDFSAKKKKKLLKSFFPDTYPSFAEEAHPPVLLPPGGAVDKFCLCK